VSVLHTFLYSILHFTNLLIPLWSTNPMKYFPPSLLHDILLCDFAALGKHKGRVTPFDHMTASLLECFATAPNNNRRFTLAKTNHFHLFRVHKSYYYNKVFRWNRFSIVFDNLRQQRSDRFFRYVLNISLLISKLFCTKGCLGGRGGGEESPLPLPLS
jgi:hypothetical protein